MFPDLGSILIPYQGILLDAYGVFWGGNEVGLLPGSKEMLEHLISSGKRVGILSNSTQLAEKEMAKLATKGITLETHFHFLVTSGEVARAFFLTNSLPVPNHRFFLFGDRASSSHEAIFKDTQYQETLDLSDAGFIYLTVPKIEGVDQTDPEVFRADLKVLIQSNLLMVCPNPDHFAHEGSPARAVVRQGSLASMYEQLGGQVFYIGKPHKMAFTKAMEQFEGIDPKNILMVGDTPETDIRGARNFGLSSALITKTGIMSERISKKGIELALKELSHTDAPDYFLERFGSFELHPNLSKKTFIIDLPLCRVLLEDDVNYPWIFLVPRRANKSRIMDLTAEDQLQLLKELDLAQNLLMDLFQPTQLNVAAIGNKTPQLHIHVIARRETDPAWPHTVWDHPARLAYPANKREEIRGLLQTKFAEMRHSF